MIPYIIDSFRAGISDENTRGVRGSFKNGYGLDIHKRRDSLSANYGMAGISSSTVVTDFIRFAVTAKDGTTYAFGDAGRIYSIAGNPSDPVIQNKATDANGIIKGAAEWQTSDGLDYLFWATNTSFARKLFPGNDAWGDQTVDYKTTLNSTDWHTMKNAGGSLIIANADALAELDYEGNFNALAMTVRPGNLIKTLEERDDEVIMGSERRDEGEEGHIWSWIVTASNWLRKKRVPVQGVNTMIDTEVLLMQGGTNGEVFFSDFTNTTPLNSAPDGGTTNPGGVSIFEDRAFFGIFGSSATVNPGLFSYGRRMRNRPFALNRDYRLSRTVAGSTVAEIGAVWTANGALFSSWRTRDDSVNEYGIDMLSSTTRSTARYEGLEFTGGTPHLRKDFRSIKVYMEPLPTNTSLSALYKVNRNTDWRYAALGAGGTTFSTANSTEAEFIVGESGKVIEVGVELNPSGSSTPEVTSIITYIGDQALEH